MRKRAARAGVSGALLVLLAFTSQEARASYDTANAENGRQVFRLCAGCHSLMADGPRRSGPHFAGLFGRRAGSVLGYNYSSALRTREFNWNGETLRALFHEGPDAYIPGTKMPVQRIADDDQLANLIEYLRQITALPEDGTKAAD